MYFVLTWETAATAKRTRVTDTNVATSFEIDRMWGMKTETVSIVIRDLGLVRKGMDKFINSVPGNINRRSPY